MAPGEILSGFCRFEIQFGSVVLYRLPIHTLIKIQGHVVCGARFLTRDVLECNITHPQSVKYYMHAI